MKRIPFANQPKSGNAVARAARILLVEDEPLNRETLTAIVEELGHSVEAVAGGNDALARLRAQSFELIITDVSMPGMSGIEFARLARELDPAIPIIYITGNANAIDSVLASGAVALLKP